MSFRALARRAVDTVIGRRSFYLTIILGVIGWAIVLGSSKYVTAVLPKYAKF